MHSGLESCRVSFPVHVLFVDSLGSGAVFNDDFYYFLPNIGSFGRVHLHLIVSCGGNNVFRRYCLEHGGTCRNS